MMHIRRPAFVSSAAVVSIGSKQSSWICSQHVTKNQVSQFHRGHVGKATIIRRPCMSTTITTEQVGEENTLSYRLKYRGITGDMMSPWHDIPVYPNVEEKQIVNFVNEIPKGMQAKMEISTDEEKNPIKQDVKKGQLRFYKYGPSLVNYGAIPQTWEDPTSIDMELNAKGDGDPLDVTEIGSSVMPFGSVYRVKILGCLALLDEGEIDWKIIAINVNDPMASKVNDIEDVEKVMPGRISEVREWFRLYKTAEGKSENEYAYGGEAKGRDFAMNVVEETHKSWADLRSGKISNGDGLAL